MVRTLAIAILATGIISLPAVAAEQYWVARDAVSKQCGAAVMLKALVEGGFISQPA